MAVINLHKFGILPEDEGTHVFTFIFENPHKLVDLKSVESSEVTYQGHRWSLVCMRKEEKYMGIYLKWRYSDGQSAPSISCKAKYTLALIHRFDYGENKYFASNQKFTTSQSLLGKSKLIALEDLLDLSGGYLDETGKRVVLELTISKCSTRYEKAIDITPNSRTKKNVSGFYYDTTTFLLMNHKWYLRVYPTKLNASGLPAVYLYLATKPNGLALEVEFRLYMGEDTTELLTYNYGEGAKYDGFGKTLSQPLINVEKLKQVTVGVEIMIVVAWRDQAVNLKQNGIYSPQLYKDFNAYRSSPSRSPRTAAFSPVGYGSSYSALTPAEAFPDLEGNFWKVDLDRSQKRLTMIFDKGVHHFQQNKTKLLCWSATLLSRDPDRANDIDMRMEPIVGYFSNFIDEKGYKFTFPIDFSELEDQNNAYSENNEIMLRITLVSLQTIPVGMRSIPRFEYQSRHLLRARRLLQEKSRNLNDMKEMAASQASLSFLDISRDEKSPSEDSALGRSSSRVQLYKSYDSLDALDTGESFLTPPAADEDFGKNFFSDLLRHIAMSNNNNYQHGNERDEPYITGRDLFNGTREDLSTESGVTVSDESSLLIEARPSPVDLNKQKEIVTTLVKLLQQRLPLRVTQVLEAGSLGTGTSTRSRMDVDLVLFSPDLPHTGQNTWMPALIHAVNSFIQNVYSHPDPFYPLPKCSYFSESPFGLQFNCGGVDIDIMLSYDWDTDENGVGGYNALYNVSSKQTSIQGRQWCALGSARLQKKFIFEQPNEVKEIIKVVKHWRNCTQWKKSAYRPNSYLLSLLVIRATEDTKSTDMKKVIGHMGSLLLSPELSIAWNVYYVSEKYPVEFEPPTPLVRDPANPGVNIAQTLPYWGQFRSEFILWMKSLGVPVTSADTT